MDPKEFDIEFVRGDTCPVEFDITNQDGEGLDDLENANIYFTVKNSFSDINYLFQKTYTAGQITKDGNKYTSKSSNQISKEWGINLGENLTIQGRLLPQPKLKYGKGNIVNPNNGNFRSGNTIKGSNISIPLLPFFEPSTNIKLHFVPFLG